MFFQKARLGDNSPVFYLLTVFVVIVALVVGNLPLFLVLAIKSGGDPTAIARLETEDGIDFTQAGLTLNYALFLLLISFVVGLITLLLFVRYVHRKPIVAVITGRNNLDWSRIFFGFGIWFGLSLLFEVVNYFLEPSNYTLQFEWSTFLPLLVIAILMIPLQTSFEEIFFRGYLMQGVGLATKSRLLALLLTSLAFGLLHISNPEVGKFGTGLMMTYYISIGLFLGICTLMDDGLELALGVHAATNIYGAVVVSFPGSALQTPTIWRIQTLNAQMMLVVGLGFSIVFLVIAALKYGWKDWSKIYGRISPQPTGEKESV